MLTLSRVSLHAAAFIAGWATTALLVYKIDNAFFAPQSPQAAPVGLQRLSAVDPVAIPAQGSQGRFTGRTGPSYANGLLTGP